LAESDVMVRLEGITKVFPGVVANDNVSFEVRRGEIHALLGENGAGKTTVTSILYGLYQADSGRIFLRGQPVEIRSTRDAIRYGIGMIHQHFMLIPTLTVVENIVLGLRSPREPFLDLASVRRRVREISREYGLEVDPDAEVWQLSVGMQQRVEIIKALYRGADLLIMDEPTSVLTPGEVHDLFRVLRQLVSEGHSVIFITHKLEEVMEIADRITVLRGGKVVATVDRARTDKSALARMMVGREVLFRLDKEQVDPGEVVLEVQDLMVYNDRGLLGLKGVSLEVREGEILGVAGVDGNGQLELAEAIAGLRPIVAGKVRIKGVDVTGAPPRSIHEMNVAHIPEDRQKTGLILDFTVKENLVLKDFYRYPLSVRGVLQHRTIQERAQELIRAFDIRCPGPDVRVRQLSGGNQQKVVLARELSRRPDLIVSMQATRGLDVGATEYVERKILEQRAAGAAILYISTELEEIFALSDRIAVLHGGELMGIVDAAQADPEEVGLMMAGAKRLYSATVGGDGGGKRHV
jgi:ABC-type uncharacterized transport system ATPase subunit